jgi:metallo-beta-lactamase class B
VNARYFPYCVLLVTLSATPLLAQGANGPADTLVEPFQIVGNVYFVGPEAEHSSYLVTTPDGHILINSGYERQLATIRGSIEKLGFTFGDIRIILGSHAHVDHQEGDAQMKALTGAQVMAMEQDVPALRDLKPGGKAHPIDRVFRSGDTVRLGGVTLTALLTAGHTEGCTTYTMEVQDGGRSYDVVIGCGFGATGRPLVNSPDYPARADDFRRTYQFARTLHADVFLGSHGQHYGLLQKLAKRGPGVNPFIDATTLPHHVDTYEKQFQDELAKQSVKAQPRN